MSSTQEIVCVTGATGYIGSWLVMRLLEHGYMVRATVRDPSNMAKVKHLLDLPKAESHLTLWKASLDEEGSYDEAIQGCHGVFHLATPTDTTVPDLEKEVIELAIKGVLDIMKACIKAKTVRRLVYTSSGVTLCMEESRKVEYDETCWTDIDFCRSARPPLWAYHVSKTLAEQEALKFDNETKLEFISVVPGLVVGPFLTPTVPGSIQAALSLITGNDGLNYLLKQFYYVHVDCLCNAYIFLYKHPKAQGRYIVSSCDATIFDVANLLNPKYPQYNVPTKFEGIIEEDTKRICFSSKKLTDLGFKFEHGLEDMCTDAVEACQAKGFLPTFDQQ